MGIIRGKIESKYEIVPKTITFGEPIFYQHTDGHWYHRETHKRAEIITLSEMFDEAEKDNERMRQEANRESESGE